MKLSVFFLLTLLLVLTGLEHSGLSVRHPQITKDHFIASLITSDAVLVPFAEYRQGHWKTHGPNHQIRQRKNLIRLRVFQTVVCRRPRPTACMVFLVPAG